MRTQTEYTDLSPSELDSLCLEMDASPDEICAQLWNSSSDRPKDLEGIDDSGHWYLFGHEYGPTHLIRASHEGDAYEIWVDEQPTIEACDIPEAYGAFDKLVEWLEARGHENTIQLRHFANRYNALFFAISTHDANNTGTWDEWHLTEGYEYQSNASGTGIVNVGHYAWYRKLSDCPEYSVKLSGSIS